MKRRNPRASKRAKGRHISEGSDFLLDSDCDEWDEDEIMEWTRDNPTTSV